MRNLKKIVVALLIATGMLVFTACGGSSGSSAGEGDSPIVVSCDTNLSANILADANLTATCTFTDGDGMIDVEASVVRVSDGVELYSEVFVVTGGNPNVVEASFNEALAVGDYNLSVVASGNGGSEFREVYSFSVINPPVWTQVSYDTGLTIQDSTDDPQDILDLNTVCSESNGNVITYSIVSISTPHDAADLAAWTDSIYIENGVLKVHNLVTNDPNWEGNVTTMVNATAVDGSSDANISFAFDNVL